MFATTLSPRARSSSVVSIRSVKAQMTPSLSAVRRASASGVSATSSWFDSTSQCSLRYASVSSKTSRVTKTLGFTIGSSRRLAPSQEFAHSIERTQNVLGRIGVGEPHVALAQNAEVRAADDGDARVVQER